MNPIVSLVVALDENKCYAYRDAESLDYIIPWKSRKDLRHFKSISCQGQSNAIIVGKGTRKALPLEGLVDRQIYVISHSKIEHDDHTFNTVAEALKEASKHHDNIIIGGGKYVYEQALELGCVDNIIISNIQSHIPPELVLDSGRQFNLDLEKYSKIRTTEESVEPSTVDCLRSIDWYEANVDEEREYLQIAKEILDSGTNCMDRTGVGTYSQFGKMMRFSLKNNTIPLLTNKRVYWKGILTELLWFINGRTDAEELRQQNVHIWDGNGSRSFLDSRGLTQNREYDLGPVYGFQWRHFGAEYIDADANYEGDGIDQLQNVIDELRVNPNSRRCLVVAWNPTDLSKMALPPCHLMFQFRAYDGKLKASMYQRSADWFLGVPFNIASYACLVHIVAQLTDLEADELVMFFGDAHIYQNHENQVKTMLARKPRIFPKININKKEKLEDYKFEDFKIEGYYPHPTIKADMAV